jgi:murein DD-endopeptidase MepM/ murein hydrolase activator NlpD
LKTHWKIFLALSFTFPHLGFSLANENEMPVAVEAVNEVLEAVTGKIDSHKKSLNSKVRAYHSLLESPEDTPDLVFVEKDLKLPKKKAQALRLMELAIRYALEEIDRLEIQRSEILSEIEWRRIQENATLTSGGAAEIATLESPAEVPGEIPVYRCQILPLDIDPLVGTKVLQDFGSRTDAVSGLKWESHGWWIGRIQSPVRACRPGKVSYVGSVAGRGRVVIVDHGQGNMTLYANLREENASKLHVGNFVGTGTILGEVAERLYFEVRRRGQAVSPREAFTADAIAKLRI